MNPVNLLPHHGEVFLFREAVPAGQADAFYQHLFQEMPWEQKPVKIFGRQIMQPRLTCAIADKGVTYSYSGLTLAAAGWTEQLNDLRAQVSRVSGTEFNTALLNLYRDGNDYMGWHRDNEPALGKNPAVVSVSFGCERIFQLREHAGKQGRVSVPLAHGDMLLMAGETQHFWEHRLPKAPGLKLPRINVTFRRVAARH